MDSSFLALQMISLEVLARPDPELVSLFLSEIRCVSDEFVQQYQKCLLLPVLSAARKKFQQTAAHEGCLNVLMEICTRSRLTSWPDLREVLGCLCVMLKNANNDPVLDECFSVALLKTLNAAISAADSAVLSAGLNNSRSQFVLFWSHIAFGCTECLQRDSGRELKISALILLKTTAGSNLGAEHTELRRTLGSVFAGFLPGVAAACTSVITQPTSSAYVGQDVIVEVLRCLSAVFCLLFENFQFVPSRADISNEQTNVAERPDPRSDQWIQQVLPKLEMVFRLLDPLSSNESPKVLIAFTEFCYSVIVDCSGKLSAVSGILLRALISLSESEHPNVNEKVENVMEQIRKAFFTAEFDELREFAHVDFMKTIENLRSTKETDEILLRQIRLSCGYIRFYDSEIQDLLLYGSTSEKLIDSLLSLCEFDEGMFDMWEVAYDIDMPYCLKFLRSRKSQNTFFELVSLLSKYEIGEVLLEQLLYKLDKNDAQRNETILILNRLLPAVSEKRRVDGCVELETVLSCFMSSELWDFSTSSHAAILSQKCIPGGVQSNQSRDFGLLEVKRQLIGLCLLMEGIGELSKNGSDFEQLLPRVLYSLLEKTEAELPVVSNRALRTLRIIAASCGFQSTSDLIKDSSEYVINDILIKIRRIHRHPKSVLTAKALVSHLDAESVPVLAKLVKVVMEKLDEYHNVAVLPFVLVLDTVVHRILAWYPPVRSEPVEEDPVASGVRYLKKGYYEEKTFAKENEVDSGCDSGEFNGHCSGEEPDVPEDEPEKEVPLYVVTVCEILKRCAYILPVDARNVRSAVLDVLHTGCKVLSAWKDQLLPVVHKMWQSIILLHRSSDFVIIRKAFCCLSVMAGVGGSFLRYRVTKEAIPTICRFLGEQCQKGLNSNVDESGAVRNLQLAFLSDLPALLRAIDAEDITCEVIANAVVGYLDSRHPKILNDAAVIFFQKLAVFQPDIVYVKMTALRSVREKTKFEKLQLDTIEISNSNWDLGVSEERICQVEDVIPCSRKLD